MHEQRRCECISRGIGRLTQEMLDLKRLYWNTRVFRGGKRKGRCPYEHLGLILPSYDFWDLLQPELASAFAKRQSQGKKPSPRSLT